WYSDRQIERSVKLDEIKGLQRYGLVGWSGSRRILNHCDVELKVQNVVFTLQKCADELLFRRLAFEFRIKFIIDIGRQTKNLIFPILIRLECADHIRFHVFQEHTRTWQRPTA